MKLSEELGQARFLAILRHIPKERILFCAEVFASLGGKFLEVTFDPSDSETLRRTGDAIRAIRREFPLLHVGAGTVLNVPMAEAAADAGAEFLVSPACSPAVIEAAAIPGAYTPNEILHAWEAGADLVKLFPILPGQEQYVRTVMSPLSHIPFLVTGGVTPETLRSMLATGADAVGAGASVFPPILVERRDRTALARQIELHLREIVHG